VEGSHPEYLYVINIRFGDLNVFGVIDAVRRIAPIIIEKKIAT